MSRRGNCHDNAVAESFFQLLKRERIRRRTYQTRAAARQDVFEYIEMFYNPKRKHTNNGMLSPPLGDARIACRQWLTSKKDSSNSKRQVSRKLGAPQSDRSKKSHTPPLCLKTSIQRLTSSNAFIIQGFPTSPLAESICQFAPPSGKPILSVGNEKALLHQ